MKKLNRWRKEGDWEIYEGKYGIAIGFDNEFSVFGKKDGVTWDEKNLKYNPYSTTYIGVFKGKAKSKGLVDKMDNTLESDKTLYIETTDKEAMPLHTTLSTKRKGTIVTYPKGDIVSKLHEEGHIKAGHATHISNIPYNDELKAIKYQIVSLDERNLWNKRNKNTVVSNLSTYSKRPYQKKRRALRDINRIEQSLGIIR
jgi:hypothetical protein